jgi:ABC-type spermidine/putrescine transport system permease subunit I
MAGRRETDPLEPIDEAIGRMVSKLPGRNVSERRGSLENAKLRRPSVSCLVGMLYQLLLYAVLPLYVTFLSIDTDLVLAAESLGAQRGRALASVVIPLAIPGLLATSIIVYVIALGFFLTPVILGGATSPFTASLIAQDIFQFYDISGASVSAVILLVAALVVVGGGYRLVGKERLRRAINA